MELELKMEYEIAIHHQLYTKHMYSFHRSPNDAFIEHMHLMFPFYMFDIEWREYFREMIAYARYKPLKVELCKYAVQFTPMTHLNIVKLLHMSPNRLHVFKHDPLKPYITTEKWTERLKQVEEVWKDLQKKGLIWYGPHRRD